MKKTILAILLLFILLAPVSVSAQGLVQCDLTGENACTFCDLFVMFQKLYNDIMIIYLPTLASIMIVLAGVYYMLSQGQPEKLAAVKKILISIAIGLFIAYAAWLIIELFLVTIGVVDLANGGWSTINCPTP